MPERSDVKGASTKFHPALIFLFCLIAAAATHKIQPIGLGGLAAFEYIGGAVAVAGVVMVFTAQFSLSRANTSIDPRGPVTRIVTSGLFAYSRNPIYLGMCLITLGVGLRKNSLIIFAGTFVLALLLKHAVIQHEEAYLEEKFGESYLRYKNKVRRWL